MSGGRGRAGPGATLAGEPRRTDQGLIWALVVLGVARFRGVAALAGVGAGFAMILVFLLPTLRRGENAAAVTLVGTVAVMLVVLYASHGVSAKTTTALFGTVAALGVTAGAAVWAASAAHQGQRFTLQAASAHANSTYPPGEDRAEPEALDVRHSSPEEFERSLVTGESMSRL